MNSGIFSNFVRLYTETKPKFMAVQVLKVISKKDMKIFVRFGNKLYKGNKYYVPSMPLDDMAMVIETIIHKIIYTDAKVQETACAHIR